MTHIEWLNKTIAMPEEPSALLSEWCAKAASDEGYAELKNKFFNGGNVHPEMAAFAEKHGITAELSELAHAELFTAHMQTIYAEKGWDMDVYLDSLKDITIWAKVCRRDYGIWGLKQFDWYSNQLRCEMFRLGRMQYHVITYSGIDYSAGGMSVKSGDKVLNIHIPEGDSLTEEKRLDSYRRAYKFFGGKYNAFTCHTYLFYERHYEILPKTSNILGFMGDFKLFDFTEKEGDDNLWRIFDRRDSYDPKTLPRDTSLRRAYAEHLERNGMKVGGARGIMLFDGENIVR